MKFGYLVFSYSKFSTFDRQLSETGAYAINLGDYMQTLAVRSLYRRLGIPDHMTVALDRDTLPDHTGEPVLLPMNACFNEWAFPLPSSVKPLFLGFQTSERVILRWREFFKAHEPIGCRDVVTANLFLRHGVAAVVTGCLTLTFEPRESVPSERRTMIVYGSGAGALPSEALGNAPPEFWENVEFVYQRKVMHSFPLSPGEMTAAETHARVLLENYKQRATLVVSPLHHAIAPCLSTGIPVILVRRRYDGRFSFLQELTKLYLPGRFSEIDWHPPMNDVSAVKTSLERRFADGVSVVVDTLGERSLHL